MRPKGSAVELEARRRMAAKLLAEGMGIRATARIVGASPGSVLRWKQAMDEGGVDALRSKPHPGRRPRLSQKRKAELVDILLAGPRAAGFGTELWTLKRVTQVIERHFGVKYHPGHVWHLLRALGWSCQKPERRARERDEDAIAAWRKVEWPRIKKKPERTVGASS